MNGIVIKKATIDDLQSLALIARQTFYEAFAADNTVDNMNLYMDAAFSTEQLSRELADTATEIYLAFNEGAVAGYLKLNHAGAQTELQDKHALEIERIYVAAAFYGKKLGQLLYEKAVEVAHRAGARYIWLGVWEANERAIRFYTKNGFVPFDTHVFRLGHDEQTDIMMRKEI